MFLLDVTKSEIIIRKRETLVSGAKNIYVCSFVFSEEWENLEKTVIFESAGGKVEVLLGEDRLVKIPWEVLRKPCNRLSLFINGVSDEEKAIRPTVGANLGTIHSGSGDSEYDYEATADLHAQILAMTNLAISAAKDCSGEVTELETAVESYAGDVDNLKKQMAEGGIKGAYEYAVEGGYQGSVEDFYRDLGRSGSFTVCGKAADENGNFTIGAKDVDALPAKGGTMRGSIDMGSQSITNLADPVDDGDAASKRFVEESVKDLTDKEPKKLIFTNTAVPAAAFVPDSTCEDYPFRASVVLEGVTAGMVPEVCFHLTEAASGIYASVAESYDGGLYLYASEAPDSDIEIPTIILWRD